MIRDGKTCTAHAIEKELDFPADGTKVKTSFATTSLDPGFILWEFVALFSVFVCFYHC